MPPKNVGWRRILVDLAIVSIVVAEKKEHERALGWRRE
jgi:hypothetical protein